MVAQFTLKTHDVTAQTVASVTVASSVLMSTTVARIKGRGERHEAKITI